MDKRQFEYLIKTIQTANKHTVAAILAHNYPRGISLDNPHDFIANYDKFVKLLDDYPLEFPELSD